MKKILIYSFLTAGLIGVLSAGAVSAHGWFKSDAQGQENMFQEKAGLLGISVDEMKNAWSQGKNFREIAEEKGITQEQLQEKMRELRQEKMQSRLQMMVDNGIITQEQANERLQNTQDRFNNGEIGRGFHKRSGECFNQ